MLGHKYFPFMKHSLLLLVVFPRIQKVVEKERRSSEDIEDYMIQVLLILDRMVKLGHSTKLFSPDCDFNT